MPIVLDIAVMAPPGPDAGDPAENGLALVLDGHAVPAVEKNQQLLPVVGPGPVQQLPARRFVGALRRTYACGINVSRGRASSASPTGPG
ncbi:hypothetical protein [Streptomyces sp. G44]|uniref:hypothetical protein n=1 Tax=Streptomyces sp. G44 TaxID=2807632 RepID=UPI001EF9A04D|nr:hypothetical protein [Streptomyces sp. G44]